MKAFNFSFNRLNLPPQNNELTTLEARALYADSFINNVAKYIGSKVLFINEATFSISMSTNKNLLSAKKRADFIGKGFRKAIASMCSAMSINGLIEHQTRMMIFDTESFYKFIESVVAKLEKTSMSEAIIIMDNACIEKYLKVKELIESKGHSLICLPPASAFLNPNEVMYIKWKELIRAKDPQDGNELIKVINKVLSQIADNDCKDFYEHMLSYLPRCMKKEEILDQ
ncbi:hypothetical protein K502DRAFT_296030 [Neoconidiobolus thromboides FSU 785]|nr:hypothetical protein K502DRAFT_296030 [Neoconidiobolus thromboides FSU 785]